MLNLEWNTLTVFGSFHLNFGTFSKTKDVQGPTWPNTCHLLHLAWLTFSFPANWRSGSWSVVVRRRPYFCGMCRITVWFCKTSKHLETVLQSLLHVQQIHGFPGALPSCESTLAERLCELACLAKTCSNCDLDLNILNTKETIRNFNLMLVDVSRC